MALSSASTMTRAELEATLAEVRKRPHGDFHKGKIILSPKIFESPDRETNLRISRFCRLDCTGNIHIGPWCMFGARARIYTHDHIHHGRRPLLQIQEAHGVLWQDKYIGADVWLHDDVKVLFQVTRIPDGVVLGAGAVLTKNPGPYEIWAGVPARKVGERKDETLAQIEAFVNQPRFTLDDF